jgi:hypothetical protein
MIFGGSLARVGIPSDRVDHVATVPKSVMNSRRRMRSPSARYKDYHLGTIGA